MKWNMEIQKVLSAKIYVSKKKTRKSVLVFLQWYVEERSILAEIKMLEDLLAFAVKFGSMSIDIDI